MVQMMENPETPKEQDRLKDPKETAEKKEEHIADEAAKRGGESESRKDQSTGVVTW